MKKICLLLAVLCLTVAGCGGKASDRLAQVQAAQELRVLVTDDAKPFSYYDDASGEYAGVEIYIAQQIAQDLGVSLVTIPVPKADLAASLPQGDIAIGRIANYESLRSSYGVSNPYAKGDLYVVTPRGVYFPTVRAFDGKSVGVSDQLSEPAKIAVGAGDGIRQETVYNAQEAVSRLLENSITGYFCYAEQALPLCENPEVQVQSLLNSEPEQYVIITGKEDAKLLAQMNQTINRLLQENAIDRYYEQHSAE